MKPRREAPTAAHLLDALRADRYPFPEWVLLTEVPLIANDGTEDRRSFADGIAIHTFPKRVLERHGIEVKRRRDDWLREREHPAKSEALRVYCHRMWLVVPAPRRDIVHDLAELGGRWGLLEVGTGGVVEIVPAPAPEMVPIEPSTSFLCGVLRAACRMTERELRGEGDAPLRTVRDIDGRFAILDPCGHRVLRPLSKKPEPRLPCWECGEEAAGPGLASALPSQPPAELKAS